MRKLLSRETTDNILLALAIAKDEDGRMVRLPIVWALTEDFRSCLNVSDEMRKDWEERK